MTLPSGGFRESMRRAGCQAAQCSAEGTETPRLAPGRESPSPVHSRDSLHLTGDIAERPRIGGSRETIRPGEMREAMRIWESRETTTRQREGRNTRPTGENRQAKRVRGKGKLVTEQRPREPLLEENIPRVQKTTNGPNVGRAGQRTGAKGAGPLRSPGSGSPADRGPGPGPGNAGAVRNPGGRT